MENYVYQNIETALKNANLTMDDLNKAYGFTDNQIKSWGQQIPINALLVISEFVDTPINDLMKKPEDNQNNITNNEDDNEIDDNELDNLSLPLVTLLKVNDNLLTDAGLELDQKLPNHEDYQNYSELQLKTTDMLNHYALLQTYSDFVYGWSNPLVSYKDVKAKFDSMLNELEPYGEIMYNPFITKSYVTELKLRVREKYESLYQTMNNVTKEG